jgi:beta-lactamase regulating signal transducer with metallopeptidase domain
VIAAFLLYATIVGAFVAATAWLVERALMGYGGRRRGVWIVAIVASVILPLLVASLREPVHRRAAAHANPSPSDIVLAGASAIPSAIRESGDSLLAGATLDSLLMNTWFLASACLLALHASGAWRLTRRSRQWRSSTVATQPVSVAPDIGPAVYGWWRPRIVFPGWLLAAPIATQTFALEHERQHLAVRDPQVLAGATLLFALVPWNMPLLWMLRRLRFAMEVDCDARVVRAGADPSAYGLALLFVSERQSRSPLGTIALIGRPSQLERRIRIMISSPRHRALIAGACAALATSCVLAASQVSPPTRIGDSPLKPVPTGSDHKLGYAFEQHIQKRYAGLLTEDVGGTPIVVALMNDDMTVAKSAQLLSDKKADEIQADESMFEAIGMQREEVPYLGAMGMQSPTDADRKLLVIFTEKRTPGVRFRSKLAPDTRELDRRLFRRNFPEVATQGVPADARPWLLLDRQGNVLRSGVEPSNPKEMNALLESRFAGIRTREITLTALVDERDEPMKDAGGKDLHLFSVWLAPESPLPGR